MANSPIGLSVVTNSLPKMQAGLAPRVLRDTERQRDQLRDAIRAHVHVVTGYMRAHIVAEAASSRGGAITTAVQSQAPYSAAEEYGGRFRPGHYRITQAVGQYAPRYRDAMAAAVRAALAAEAA